MTDILPRECRVCGTADKSKLVKSKRDAEGLARLCRKCKHQMSKKRNAKPASPYEPVIHTGLKCYRCGGDVKDRILPPGVKPHKMIYCTPCKDMDRSSEFTTRASIPNHNYV